MTAQATYLQRTKTEHTCFLAAMKAAVSLDRGFAERRTYAVFQRILPILSGQVFNAIHHAPDIRTLDLRARAINSDLLLACAQIPHRDLDRVINYLHLLCCSCDEEQHIHNTPLHQFFPLLKVMLHARINYDLKTKSLTDDEWAEIMNPEDMPRIRQSTPKSKLTAQGQLSQRYEREINKLIATLSDRDQHYIKELTQRAYPQQASFLTLKSIVGFIWLMYLISEIIKYCLNDKLQKRNLL